MAYKHNFMIRVASADHVDSILEFHKKHLTDYLWPRTRKDFEDYIEDECLYEVVENSDGEDKIVGICYIVEGEDPDTNAERYEFGGVFILKEYRGFGLASVLGLASISQHYVSESPKELLIAHVHEFNNDPRDLLEKRLGFCRDGQEIPPADKAPPTMKRNDKGEVVGHLYKFNTKKLLEFAAWLEKFDGELGAEVSLELDLWMMNEFTNTINSLKDQGAT